MSDKDRKATLDAAIADGDDATLAAVLHGPTFLTGLGTAERAARLRQWQEKHRAGELDLRERLQKAAAAMNTAGSLAIVYANDLTDAKIVAEATSCLRQPAARNTQKHQPEISRQTLTFVGSARTSLQRWLHCPQSAAAQPLPAGRLPASQYHSGKAGEARRNRSNCSNAHRLHAACTCPVSGNMSGNNRAVSRADGVIL
jgi:hypothetical protein